MCQYRARGKDQPLISTLFLSNMNNYQVFKILIDFNNKMKCEILIDFIAFTILKLQPST